MGDDDRLQHCEGVEAAGAADVDLNGVELRGGLGGRELVGDGPARLAADDAHRALQGELIDLDDEAVDLVVEGLAVGLEALDVLDDGFEVGTGLWLAFCSSDSKPRPNRGRVFGKQLTSSFSSPMPSPVIALLIVFIGVSKVSQLVSGFTLILPPHLFVL